MVMDYPTGDNTSAVHSEGIKPREDVAVAEVLAAHWPRRLRCGCGEILRWADSGERESAWAVHVAEALAPLIAEREARAWDEGYEASTCDVEARSAPPGPNGPVDPTPNPYHADRRAE